MSARILTLDEGRLYALANPYELNGQVSTHPSDARGFATMNVYVVIEPDRALVVDTGWSIHADAVIEQLAEIVPEGLPLGIVLTRAGEFNAICNVRAIFERYGGGPLYGLYHDLSEWVDVRPGQTPYGSPLRSGIMASAEDRQRRHGESIELGSSRALAMVAPPLRLLPTCWLYDDATRTLFTADGFTHVWRDTPDGPWMVTDPQEATDVRELAAYLTGARYWWLAEADATPIAAALRELHGTYRPERIAPGFGAIFEGSDVVDAQFDALEQALLGMGG